MSYLNLNNNKFEEDIISRKEFIENEYRKYNNTEFDNNIINNQ